MRLTEAVEAAEARKCAVVGEEREAGIAFTTESQTRALLSGWDIDYEEFRVLSHRAGHFFWRATLLAPVPESCRAAWTDGLLIGLMLAKDHHGPVRTD